MGRKVGAVVWARAVTYFDAVPPVLTASANPNRLVPVNGKKVAVTVSGQVTDIGLGVRTDSGTFKVQDSFKQIEPTGIFGIAPDGTYSFVIQLAADLKQKDKGNNNDEATGNEDQLLRLYTITVRAQDKAGNEGSATVLVGVKQ